MQNEYMQERFARHLMLPEIGEEGQRKLSRSRVLLVGVGGLGSPVALYLAAAGVGRIGMADDDTVSLSNLQRQVLYSEAEVGQRKVECARHRLLGLNSHVEVDAYPFRLTEENAVELLSQYDVVVDGTDNFFSRYLIGDVSARLGIPYVYGAIREFDGQVSVFNLPGGRNYRDLYPDEEETCAISRPPVGVVGVLPGIVGCVEASETIKLVTGAGEPLSGKLWTIDLLTMQSHVVYF